ncbi:ankyrin repeat-containing domain protein [Terfezia claveryi]|nr:ankyrin repeat-containing domain protein [Terfezia claveryi]
MGADINERNSNGETALLEAVYNNNLSCVKLLIGRGADATISTHEGTTVLHWAAQLADSEMIRFLLDVVETRNLVNMTNWDGDTPLHCCSCRTYNPPIVQIEMAKLLIQAGALLTIGHKSSGTPYECARVQGQNELAQYLWTQLSPKQQAQENPCPYWRRIIPDGN